MWRAIVERETYAELAATLQRPLAVHDLPHDKGDPEQLAVEIRNLLGVTGADHKRFGCGYFRTTRQDPFGCNLP